MPSFQDDNIPPQNQGVSPRHVQVRARTHHLNSSDFILCDYTPSFQDNNMPPQNQGVKPRHGQTSDEVQQSPMIPATFDYLAINHFMDS